MDDKNRANVKIVLADGDTYIRQGFRNALTNIGFREVRALNRLTQLREVIVAMMPDLLVIDTEMPDGDPIAFVADIRNGCLGRNPFLPVIVTSWDTDRDVVRRVVDCGADMMLVKPLAPTQLFQRIDSLINYRKPFIVTADYIGPDRRAEPGTGDLGEPFEVPNTLKEKMEGKPLDFARLHAQIESMMQEMNETRLMRAAYQIAFLVGLVTNAYDQGKVSRETKIQIGRIIQISEDVANRVVRTRCANLTDLCRSLVRVARDIHRRPKRADRKQVDLLKPLSDSILLGANPELDATTVTLTVAKMVDGYAGQRKVGDPLLAA